MSSSTTIAAPYVAPLSLHELNDVQREMMEGAEALMGFMPNDALTMARIPGLLEALAALVGAAFASEHLDEETRRLVALMSSEAAGCRYCKAHTRYGALREGLPATSLANLWSFESSSAFSEAQKAAMHVAWLGSLTPNQVEDDHMQRLRRHFSEEEVLDITAVIALFGFLNRWNDTIKTTIEDGPLAALAPDTPENT